MRKFLFSAARRGTGAPMQTPVDPRFRAAGEVETLVWAVWDLYGKSLLQDEIIDPAVIDGEMYAQYWVQENLMALVRMCGRLNRAERLEEIADFVEPMLDERESFTNYDSKSIRVWVQRNSNSPYGQYGQANPLMNSQGGAFYAVLAYEMLRCGLTEHPVLDEAISAAIDTSLLVVNNYRKGLAETAALKTPNDSGIDVTGDDLWWALLIWCLVCKMYEDYPERIPDTHFAYAATIFPAFFQQFNARWTGTNLIDGSGKPATGAVLDAGFMIAVYGGSDERYALDDSMGASPDPLTPLPPDNIGWDISHMMRWAWVTPIYHMCKGDLAKHLSLGSMLAENFESHVINQVLWAIWNRNVEKPVWATYWSGERGWFAGMDQRDYTGLAMQEGMGAFGEISRPIADLCRQIYVRCKDFKGDSFQTTFYGNFGIYDPLSGYGGSGTDTMRQLATWPTLIVP